MTVRRRSVLMSAAFLALAALAVGSRDAAAQPPRVSIAPNPDDIPTYPQPITPDQARAALLRLTGGDSKFAPDMQSLADLVRRKVQESNPNFDPALLDSTIRKFVNDPERMKQFRDIAEKQAKSGGKAPDPGDIGKLFKDMPKDLPLPKDFGKKFGPDIGKELFGGGRIPQTGSNTFPKLGPTLPRGSDPPSAVPPPRPPTGNGSDVVPPQGKGGTEPPPVMPPIANPPVVQPPDFPQGVGQPKAPDPFDQNSESSARGKALRALAGAWENNIGPLSETPAVQRALTELVTGVGDLKDADGNSLWSSLGKELNETGSFNNFLEGAKLGEWNLNMPSMNWPSFRLGNFGGGGGGSSSTPRGGSSGSSSSGGRSGFGSLGIPGLEGSWLPVVLLAAILLGGLIWWRFVYLRDPQREVVEFAGAGLGPWPLDPRSIATREDVVRAFEYLSVLVCGPEAKTWTHATIAEALAIQVRTHGETALMLARLYELARYAPLTEPLSPNELSEARRLVCAIAGVGHA